MFIIAQTTEKSKTAQRDKIVEYIRRNGSATVRELFVILNINSPCKRVSELRKQGLIDTVKCTRENSSGETVRFVRYYLKGAQNGQL